MEGGLVPKPGSIRTRLDTFTSAGTRRARSIDADVNVPGAIVELSGQYSLTREIFAFNGSLYMDAKVSQTTTGWKSLMLKVVDPMFRKDGRTVIPIKIGGTRDEPSFGMDARRVFRR